jgi:hypothetical protein
MKESNYDSYCGLYCGACDILRCYEKGHESKFVSLWTELTLKAFLKSQGANYSGDDDLKLKCLGCKSDDVFIVCRSCKIRECAISKNLSIALTAVITHVKFITTGKKYKYFYHI